MRKFNQDVSEQQFNLIWKALAARESQLLKIIEEENEDDDSDLAAMASNDLIYLRLYQKSLKEEAEKANFDSSVFSLSDEVIDLSDLCK